MMDTSSPQPLQRRQPPPALSQSTHTPGSPTAVECSQADTLALPDVNRLAGIPHGPEDAVHLVEGEGIAPLQRIPQSLPCGLSRRGILAVTSSST